ncbi:transferrin-binding protein-like solute binding protein [Shimia marina]|nr:transferrin-binding protein-like solute binding protein [Shimia marina]
MKYKFTIAALLCATALSACGGGGSSSDATPFTEISDLPDSGSVALQGEAVTMNYRRNTVTGRLTFEDPSRPTDSTLTATFRNGEQVATRATAGSSGFNIDTRDDGTSSVSQHIAVLSSSSDRSVAIFANPETAGLDHTSYGTWLDGDTNTRGSVAAGSYGSRTAAADVPTSGTATYNGKGVGMATVGDGDLYGTEFDVTLSTTDFNTVAISSNNTLATNLIDGGTSRLSSLDFNGTGTITDSGFNANLTSGSGTGSTQGNFFGPNAEEVGGTFSVSGSTVTHIGAYGASQP